MVLIKSIIRPEKVDQVMEALMESGYPAVTKVSVFGRGKQRGIKIGDITYDELPKQMLITVVKESDKDFVVDTIVSNARTGQGKYGDGKIFVQPVSEMITVSSGHVETSSRDVEVEA